MASTEAATRDYLWCPKSGYIINFDVDSKTAACNVSGYKQPLAKMNSVCVVHKTEMAELYRREKIVPVVKPDDAVEEVTRKRAIVDETCPKCGHKGLEFYTMQMRSADEGQTVFYECPKCKWMDKQNT